MNEPNFEGFADLENAADWGDDAVLADDSVSSEDKLAESMFGAAESKNVNAIYEEKCTACRGTGTWTSWSGRSSGGCFKCKSTGTRKFKTSPETRAKAKEAAAKRKQKKADAKVVAAEEYRTEHAVFVAYLEEVSGWNNFAASMLQAIKDYGSLTGPQRAAADKMHAKHIAKQEAQAAEPQVETVDLTDVPAGLYAVPNGETRLKIAIRKPGQNSKWHGSIFVDDGAEYGARQNYGRQMPGKQYEGKIVEQLKVIAADPLEAMKAYGHLVGQCGRCGRKLEDEKSIELGIGPVCITKM